MAANRFTGFSRLAKAELALFVLLFLHTVDHGVNQPSRELPAGTGVAAAGGFAIVAIALVMALGRSRLAPLAGVLAGGATVIGFLAIHLIGFGPTSDPYRDFDADLISWVLLLAPTIAAAVVATIGAQELRDERAATGQRTS